MPYNSRKASGAHAQRTSEVQADEDQAKLPWFRGLILWGSLEGGS